jgi:hypothetical protein
MTKTISYLWPSLFLPFLRDNGLIGLVDGSKACPAKFLQVQEDGATRDTVVNPDYEEWVQKDQNLLSWIN